MSVCRVCMRVSGDEEEAYLDIFKTVIELENDQEALVAEVIQDLCNEVVFKADDKITTKVCRDCGKRLRDAYELKHLIEESERQLQLKLLTEEHTDDTVITIKQEDDLSMDGEAEDYYSEENTVDFPTNEYFKEEYGKNTSLVPHEKRKYKCYTCDNRFICKSDLVDHIRADAHISEVEYEVEIIPVHSPRPVVSPWRRLQNSFGHWKDWKESKAGKGILSGLLNGKSFSLQSMLNSMTTDQKDHLKHSIPMNLTKFLKTPVKTRKIKGVPHYYL